MQHPTGERTSSGHMAGSHWRAAAAADRRGRARASPPSHVPAASWPPRLRAGARGLTRRAMCLPLVGTEPSEWIAPVGRVGRPAGPTGGGRW
jgi:hypothetical protein